jgi:hypothetical protein
MEHRGRRTGWLLSSLLAASSVACEPRHAVESDRGRTPQGPRVMVQESFGDAGVDSAFTGTSSGGVEQPEGTGGASEMGGPGDTGLNTGGADGSAGGAGVPTPVGGATGASGVAVMNNEGTPPATPVGTLPPAVLESTEIDCDGLGPSADCQSTGSCDGLCATLPEGWLGPVAFFEGNPFQVPSCGGSYATEVFTLFGGLEVPSTVCPNCECVAASTLSCNDRAWLELHGDGTCSEFLSDFDSEPWVLDGFCYSFRAGDVQSLRASFDLTGTGGCSALTNGQAGIPAFSWTEVARGCLLSECPDGQGCAPLPPAPYAADLCVYQTGDALGCPLGYPEQSVYYAGASDTRACSACSCGNPECDAAFDLYTDSFCGQGRVRVEGQGPLCQPFAPPGNTMSAFYLGGAPVCEAVPPMPLGEVLPQAPVTICCQVP